MARGDFRLSPKGKCPHCGRKNFCNDHLFMNEMWFREYEKAMVSWRHT